MTDKPTPKEIDDLVYELRHAGKDDAYSLASAVLAKWGQPAQAEAPVAYSIGNTLKWHEGKGLTNAQLYTAPQPVEREPLTNAQREKIIEAVDWYNFPQDVIDAVERAHGIKGGQHGTE